MTFSEIKPNLIENNRFNMKEVIEHYSLGSEEISIATGYIDLKVFGSLRKSLEKFKENKAGPSTLQENQANIFL